MPNMSQAELNAFNARRFSQKLPALKDAAEKESDLHAEILAECRRRGWIAIHSRMDRPTTSRIGTPDFIVCGDNGRFWMVEAKRKGGKLSEEQLALKAWANRLGHEIATVYSFEQFLEVITKPSEPFICTDCGDGRTLLFETQMKPSGPTVNVCANCLNDRKCFTPNTGKDEE